MAFVAYRTWVAGETVNEDHMNEQIRDNGNYLKTLLDAAVADIVLEKVKKMWFPCSASLYNGLTVFNSALIEGWAAIALNDWVSCSFRIPDDFVSLVEAKLVTYPTTTDAALNWDISSQYAGNGQALTTHTESNTATTYNGTTDQRLDVDVSGILTGIAAGDAGWVKILLATAEDDFACRGLYIEYNSTA